MITLFCNADKYLSIVSDTANSYETEDKATKIVVNMTPVCCGYSIADSKVDLCISTPDRKIYVLPCSIINGEEYCTAEVWLDDNHTAEPGVIKLWLEIENIEAGANLKTNVVTKNNKEHNIVSNNGHNSSGIITEKLDEAVAAVKNSATEAKQYAEQAREIANELSGVVVNTPYIQDGYWYVYNAETKTYEKDIYAGGTGGGNIIIDSELSKESANAVQNCVIANKFAEVEATVGNIDALFGTI